MRALAGMNVFTELAPDTFGLTPLAATLRSGAPGSLRQLARFEGMPVRMRAFDELIYSVRSGRPAFPRVHGTDWWSYLAAVPEHAALFNDAMGDLSRQVHAAAVEACDLSGVRRLVDIGGGHGHLVATILGRYPEMSAVVFDRPEVVAGAANVLAEAEVGDRATVVGGNFFAAVPAGADAYLMSMILHDWDDQDAVRILRNVRTAMPPDGRVIVVDAVLPESGAAHPGRLGDIIMLALHPGRERSEAEFAALLEAAGLRHVETKVASAMTGLLVAVPAGESASGSRLAPPGHDR
jgi:predicted O-methyltransferase YrrM